MPHHENNPFAERSVRELMNRDQRDYDLRDRPGRHIWNVGWLELEIDNGGLHQYFLNCQGDHWRNTLVALQEIGSTEVFAILREACSRFPGGQPSDDQSERQEQLDHVPGEYLAFRDLDNRFQERDEDLNMLLIAYWDEHHTDRA